MSTPSPFGAIDPGTQAGLGNLLSLGGTGVGLYNQQQGYNTLQNALNTIGPTQLQGFNLAGPGGLSSGYNPQTGQSNINLGSLNPAFGGFAGAAGQGSNAYQAGLPSGLATTSLGTLPAALNTLGSAYGNYNTGIGAANQQLGNLGDFNTTYNNLLQAQYGQLQPQIQQQAFGLQNTLFGNGVADSTGAASGSLAAQNFGRGVGQAQSTAQLNAFQQALAQQNSAAQNYGTLSAGAGNILSNAFNNFGNTNQLISGLNTAGLNNATTAAQGAGALNSVGLNNYNAALQTGSAQATARNQSLFPYASVATSLANQPNAMTGLGSLLTGAGSSIGGNNSGLTSMLQQLFGGGNVVGSNGLPISSADWGSAYGDLGSSTGTQLGSDFGNIVGDTGFSSAGGGAATGTGLGSTGSAGSFAGASGSLGGDAAAAGGSLGTAGAADAGFSGAAGSLGGDAAASAAAGDAGAAGTAGAASSLAAAWPVAAATAGFLGLDAIFNHNSIESNAAAMGDVSQGIPALQAAAASPQAALARNQGYLPPGMTAADLQAADASNAQLLAYLRAGYANGTINAETNTNSLGLLGYGSPGNLGARNLLRPT